MGMNHHPGIGYQYQYGGICGLLYQLVHANEPQSSSFFNVMHILLCTAHKDYDRFMIAVFL